MKAFSILSALFITLSFSAQAQMMLTNPPIGRPQTGEILAPVRASSLDFIPVNGKLRCGTNLRVPSYAHLEDNVWHGIDADFCRVLAQAIVGDRDKIEMIHVGSDKIIEALNGNKIDVMLSGAAYSAQMETSRHVLGIGPLYFDNQKIMVRGNGSEDLATYKDKRICIPTDNDSLRAFDEYNSQHNFGIRFLTFKNLDQAMDAFLLKRCDLITANSLMLQGVKQSQPKLEANILPVIIAAHPMYALVRYDNTDLYLAVKWVFNALFLAEQYGIKSNNLGFYATNDNPELRNMFGDDPEMWRGLHIQPDWLRKAIDAVGNYADIYERNIGMESEYFVPRSAGKLLHDGGSIVPLPFM
jgi:general L-amino acid transport system substrate-binding protein